MRYWKLSLLKVHIFLILGNFQNCKFLETLGWDVILHFYCKNLVVDRKHVGVMCEKKLSKQIWNECVMNCQSWPSKKILTKNINFHLFWGKQKSWPIWNCDKNSTSSFYSAPSFKMMKTLGTTTKLLMTFTIMLHKATKSFLSC